MKFADVVKFHGHACPGLAFGFRVSEVALRETGRARDEELVGVVENNSCAVDAIQVVTGCTFGKGNLIFKDYGKQVYTFIKRPTGEAVRIAVIWEAPAEDTQTTEMWKNFSRGDRSKEVMQAIKARKAAKMKGILAADPKDLFDIRHLTIQVPEAARVFASVRCSVCNEKIMEPRARIIEDKIYCIPCASETV